MSTTIEENQTEEQISTVKLSTPITSIDREIKEITFREPLGKDLRRIGMPMKMSAEGTEIDTDRMGRYIEVLGNLAIGDADKLSVKDFTVCLTKVTHFFTV